MKKLFVITACILYVMQGFAQDELSISGGLSFPVGDFGGTSGGAAKIGVASDIMYQHRIEEKSKLWIAGMVRFQSYKVDIAQFEQAFPGMQISCTNWEAISFLVGPVIKFDLTETSSFEPRILLGYMTAKSPSVSIKSGGASASVDPDDGGAFATMLGASYKFRASHKMSIVAGLDYLIANPKFTIKASGVPSSQESNQQISSLSLLLGLSFKLK